VGGSSLAGFALDRLRHQRLVGEANRDATGPGLEAAQMLKPRDDLVALIRRVLQILRPSIGLQTSLDFGLKGRLDIGRKSFKINGFMGLACFTNSRTEISVIPGQMSVCF